MQVWYSSLPTEREERVFASLPSVGFCCQVRRVGGEAGVISTVLPPPAPLLPFSRTPGVGESRGKTVPSEDS